MHCLLQKQSDKINYYIILKDFSTERIIMRYILLLTNNEIQFLIKLYSDNKIIVMMICLAFLVGPPRLFMTRFQQRDQFIIMAHKYNEWCICSIQYLTSGADYFLKWFIMLVIARYSVPVL